MCIHTHTHMHGYLYRPHHCIRIPYDREYNLHELFLLGLFAYISWKGETCTAVHCVHANANVSSYGKMHSDLKHCTVHIVDLLLLYAKHTSTFYSCCFLIRYFRTVFFFCLRLDFPSYEVRVHTSI